MAREGGAFVLLDIRRTHHLFSESALSGKSPWWNRVQRMWFYSTLAFSPPPQTETWHVTCYRREGTFPQHLPLPHLQLYLLSISAEPLRWGKISLEPSFATGGWLHRWEREPSRHHMAQNFMEFNITEFSELLQGLSPFGRGRKGTV